MPSAVGRLLLLVGACGFFFSAYSVHEERVKVQSSAAKYFPSPLLIGYLATSLYLILVGILMTAPALKEVTWQSEMRKRSIDQMDARIGFASVRHRGHLLFGDAASAASARPLPAATGRGP